MEIHDLKQGNLILFDHQQGSKRTVPIIRGTVDKIEGDKIIMTGGFKAHKDTCAPIPLDQSWFHFYALDTKEYKGLRFVHELQNAYFDKNKKLLEPVNLR